MSPDDVENLTFELHDFLVNEMRVQLDEEDDYQSLSNFLFLNLDKFITRERNFN